MNKKKILHYILENPVTYIVIIISIWLIGLLYINAYQRTHQNELAGIENSIEDDSMTPKEDFYEGQEEWEDIQDHDDEDFEYKASTEEEEGNIVVFNPKTLKFHKKTCEWAIKCKRCIKIQEEEAIEQGGVPCKVCGAKN